LKFKDNGDKNIVYDKAKHLVGVDNDVLAVFIPE
jgi:hypothetical protein